MSISFIPNPLEGWIGRENSWSWTIQRCNTYFTSHVCRWHCLFVRANIVEAQHLREGLHRFEVYSGQKKNIRKFGLFFSKNTSRKLKENIRNFMQMNYLQKDSKYLGIPMFLSKSKSKDFQYLITKVQAWLVGWRKNALSYTGRFTMISSVLQ